MPVPRPAHRLAQQRENKKKHRKLANEEAKQLLAEKKFIFEKEKNDLDPCSLGHVWKITIVITSIPWVDCLLERA